MCRHLAWLGDPVGLHALLWEPPYALVEQAAAPRRQRHGRVNADGYGVGWYVEGRAAPVRYRRAGPMWADTSFASVAEVLSARCLCAAVRDATPGFPVEESGTAPFAAGQWLFSHNGRVDDLAGLAELAPPLPAYRDTLAPVDSALLFAGALRVWLRGGRLADGLAEVVTAAAALGGRLNLLATDGQAVAATAYGDTLFWQEGPRGVAVASEPYDDTPGWRSVPNRSLLTADPDGVRLVSLP